jgi:hypothetical protein
MKKIFFLCCVLFLMGEKSALALALDGTTWERLPDMAKDFWIVGVTEAFVALDGLTIIDKEKLSVELSVKEQVYHNISLCLQAQKKAQTTAIVQKYVTENPKQWHDPMIIIFLNALRDACRNE